MGKVLYIASGRGGTGKSVFAANLASEYALTGNKTLLIDMNPGMRTQDLLLGVADQAIYHVFDVMKGLCPLDQALLIPEAVPELRLLAGGMMEERESFEEEKWRELLRQVKPQYDVIIADGSAGADDLVCQCARAADETILVITPEATAVRNADALEDALIRRRVMRRRYVLNRVHPELERRHLEPDAAELDGRLRCEILGIVLEDENFRTFADAGIPVVRKRDSYIASNFARIASRALK